MRQKYKDKWHEGTPGARWALFAKFVISRVPGDPYLTRWRIVQTPWFGILLHKIDGPDPDLDPHDHPWKFISIVLRGGYCEAVTWYEKHPTNAMALNVRVTTVQKHEWLSMHRMRMGTYHRITHLFKKPTWTLVLTGPRRADWGFLTREGKHVQWQKYLGL